MSNTIPELDNAPSGLIYNQTQLDLIGEITYLGGAGATVTKRGFLYLQGSTGDPTYTTNDGKVEETASSYPVGHYTLALTSLSANTTYRVRAFAENGEGYGYSPTITITTLDSDTYVHSTRFTSVTTGGGASWTNLSNVLQDDTSSASSTLITQYANFYVEDLYSQVPAGAAISGVAIIIKAGSSGVVQTRFNESQLRINGSNTGEDKNSTNKPYYQNRGIYTLGGTSDLWSISGGISLSQINASNFGFWHEVQFMSEDPYSEIDLQYVGIAVYYTYPSQALTGVASLSSTPAVAGTLTAQQTRPFTGVASLSGVPSVAGSIITNKNRQFTGVASLSETPSIAGILEAGVEQLLTGVASLSEVPSLSGTLSKGFILSGSASLSETPSQPGDLSTGYILSGVASLSETPSIAGDLAAYTAQLFEGVASLSQVPSESGTLVADSDQILTGVASLSSTPAVAGTALIAQLFAVTGVASLSEVPSVSGTTIIKQAIVAQGVASLSASPTLAGSTIIGTLASGVASLSGASALVGTHIAGQIYTGVASLSEAPSVAGTLTALQTILSQYGFRFRNDDGTDVTATWRASQNSNIALSGEDSFRIRFGINGNDDPSITPQLEYRLKKSGGAFGDWKKVTNGN